MRRKLDIINGEAPGGGVRTVSNAEAEGAFRTILQWIGEDPTATDCARRPTGSCARSANISPATTRTRSRC